MYIYIDILYILCICIYIHLQYLKNSKKIEKKIARLQATAAPEEEKA